MDQIDEIREGAAKEGMYVVDSGNNSAIVAEYEAVLVTADELIAVVDPVTNPYDSKYAARKAIDDVCNKIDATKTIASLEKNADTIKDMNWRLASLRVKLGGISWEVEEPHNAQTELEEAAEYYVQGITGAVASQTMDADDSTSEEESVKSVANDSTINSLAALSIPLTIDDALKECYTTSTKKSLGLGILVDAMKCFNLLGILWAGRTNVSRSLLYLAVAKHIHSAYGKQEEAEVIDPALPPVPPAASATKPQTAIQKQQTRLELEYTHTLFYMAQAFGHLGDSRTSCVYCYETLKRQLSEEPITNAASKPDLSKSLISLLFCMTDDTTMAVENQHRVMEWINNCQTLSDFFIAIHDYARSAYVLTISERMLQQFQAQLLLQPTSDNVTSESIEELEANLARRWCTLDSNLLREASAECQYYREQQATGEVSEPITIQAPPEGVVASANPLLFAFADPFSPFPGAHYHTVKLLELPFVLPPMNPGDDPTNKMTAITNFSDARSVFLRALVKMEVAKRFYQLDGHVTDHTTLLQQQSKLYHYLAIFEDDLKRKLAMEMRRIELLTPVLKSINRTAFEALHKQLSYELGEVYLTCLETKMEKISSKSGSAAGGEVPRMKPAEMANCNEFCRGALACFTHFCNMYANAKDTDVFGNLYNPPSGVVLTTTESSGPVAMSQCRLLDESIDGVIKSLCLKPNYELISAEEVRPYVNSIFLTCRALSKILVPVDGAKKAVKTSAITSTPPQQSAAMYVAESLKRYEWLNKKVVNLCTEKEVDVADTFQQELLIVKEMVQLLPAKIDRMHYGGM